MANNDNRCTEIKVQLDKCFQVCENYSWLLNAYVSDFYVQNHWERLPKKWRESLKDAELELISNVIDSNKPLQMTGVLPASLLALRNLIKELQVPRKQSVKDSLKLDSEHDVFSIDRFNNVFWKRVKAKKKHEIELISKMCFESAVETNCRYVVDIGSGLGHLGRMLSYGYGLKVCCFEVQEYLTNEARKINEEMEKVLLKRVGNELPNYCKPIHVNMDVISSSDDDILKAIKEAFGEETSDFQFGIVGLHPCGDLSSRLIQLFKKFPQVKFINIVSCCYNKLSESLGYPLSEYCKERNYSFRYAAREVACHAIETYVEKLNSGQSWQLRIHAYRAALEKLIVEKSPNLVHSQVNSVKFHKGLTFSEYCRKSLTKLNIELSQSRIDSREIQNDIEDWKKVVIFYSLRLMIAPLVETMILLDRQLFILESGDKCDMIPIFDPKISPRNHVLKGLKSD